jgi:hypothetical protein
MHHRIALAFLLLASLATAAAAQTDRPCFPAQPCPNGVKVPFPVISPVQGLNSLAQQLRLQRQGEHAEQAPPAGWYYAPVATPPPYLPPNLQPNAQPNPPPR